MKDTLLTKKHLAIFHVLLETGPITTGPLSERTSIPTSHIYTLLTELQDLGLVGLSRKNNRTFFSATSIDALQRIIDKEKEELDSIVKEAKHIQREDRKEETSLTRYEGIRAIKGMWDSLNNSMNNASIVKFYTATPQAYKSFIGFYNEHHRLQRKIHTKEKIIFDIRDKEARRRKNKITDVRLLELNNSAEWGIIDEQAFFQYIISHKPVSILIKDKMIVDTLHQVYDQLWKIAKRL